MSIDRRPSGQWRARWRDSPRGPQHSASFATKRAAQDHLAAVRARAVQGDAIDHRAAQRPLVDVWAEWSARQSWRTATRQTTATAWSRIGPTLGHLPVGRIRPSDVEALVATMRSGGLAPGTVRLTISRLRACLAALVRDGVLSRNAAATARLGATAGAEVRIPTVDEVDALLALADPMLRAAVLLAARAGLRRGEVLGLTADRVGWLAVAPTIAVDRQSVRATQDEPMTFGPPKTPASTRTVPVPRSVLDDLAACGAPGEEGLLVHLDGQGLSPNTFDGRWRRLVRQAGLDGLRFHDLRHHWCSTLLSAGVSVVAVARAAGHNSPAVTLNVYGHVMGDDHDKIRRALEPAESWLSPGAIGETTT